MSLNFLSTTLLILISYCTYNVLRRKLNPQYGINNQNLSFIKFFIGIAAIQIIHFVTAVILVRKSPTEVMSIIQILGVANFILFLIYMELIEYLLRNGKANWFKKMSSN